MCLKNEANNTPYEDKAVLENNIIGDLSDLDTQEKANIVSAINEVYKRTISSVDLENRMDGKISVHNQSNESHKDILNKISDLEAANGYPYAKTIDNQDLNNVVQTGCYYVYDCENIPGEGKWYLEVFVTKDKSVFQRAKCLSGSLVGDNRERLYVVSSESWTQWSDNIGEGDEQSIFKRVQDVELLLKEVTPKVKLNEENIQNINSNIDTLNRSIEDIKSDNSQHKLSIDSLNISTKDLFDKVEPISKQLSDTLEIVNDSNSSVNFIRQEFEQLIDKVDINSKSISSLNDEVLALSTNINGFTLYTNISQLNQKEGEEDLSDCIYNMNNSSIAIININPSFNINQYPNKHGILKVFKDENGNANVYFCTTDGYREYRGCITPSNRYMWLELCTSTKENIVLLNGFMAYDYEDDKVTVCRTGQMCCINGRIVNKTHNVDRVVVFTLPTEYRPKNKTRCYFLNEDNLSPVLCEINKNGDVIIVGGYANTNSPILINVTYNI